MCGRYELNDTPARLGSRYRIEPGDLDFAQNADVRPTDTNPVHGYRWCRNMCPACPHVAGLRIGAGMATREALRNRS